MDLTACDLSGVNLAGVNLTRAILTNAKLTGTNLSGSVLQYANLSNAILTGANLQGAGAQWATLTSANLQHADLTQASLASADLTQADFTGAKVVGTNFTYATWSSTICPDGTNSNSDGNTCTANLTIKDATAPSTTASTSTQPNSAGWYNAAVSITLSATDPDDSVSATYYAIDNSACAPSNIPACTAYNGSALTVSGDGTHTIYFFSLDAHANSEQVRSQTIMIDTAAPSITASATTADDNPYSPGTWTNQRVTVHFTCSAGISGIQSCPSDVTVSTEGGNQTVSGTAYSNAGKSAGATFSGINLDMSAPSVTPQPGRGPDSNGWYNHPFTLNWSGLDSLSGIASCSNGATYSGPDTATGSLSGTCADKVGNASAPTAFNFKYDGTAPTVSLSGNAGSYTVDQTVSITCKAADPVSNGVASGIDVSKTTCANIKAPAYSFNVIRVNGSNGVNTATATASDMAGNVRTTSTTFTVRVTSTSLCNLTWQFVRASSTYRSLPTTSPSRAAVDKYVTQMCTALALAGATTSSGTKAALITAYQTGVGTLQTATLVSRAQGTALTNLSRGI